MASRGLRLVSAIAAIALGFGLPSPVAASTSRAAGVSGPGRQVVALAAGGPAAAGDEATAPTIESAGDGSATPAPSTADALAGPVTATFVVTYDAGFTTAARNAFQAAVDVWAHLITSSVPITITAHWKPLGGSILGSAGPTAIERDFSGRPIAGTWYPVALANARFGSDLDPQHADIDASFNSSFSSWYLGTDGSPTVSQYDLETIVVHELAHGLGFIGSMNVSGGVGTWGSGGYPFAYDRFTENGAGNSLLNTTSFPNGSPELAAQLTSSSVFFDGPKADFANGGTRPELYAPSTWSAGSSYAHLDENTYPPSDPNSLMTPTFSAGPQEVHHAPGPIVLGIMGDTGWNDVTGIDPSLFVTPATYDFGFVFIPNSADATIVVTNVGGTTLTITSSTAPSSPFSATMPANGTTIAGGKSLGIPIHFAASTPGYPTGSLSLQTSGGNTTVTLKGAARSHTGTQAYVIAAYTDFLGRAPTTNELNSATNQLDSGTLTVTGFINQLSTSPQWVAAIVTSLYQNTLGRNPDPGGLDYWSGIIRNGTLTVAGVAAQFYGSDEYFNGFGHGDVTTWVRDLYVKILGRQGDPDGVNYWASQVANIGRVGVAYPFYQSSESAHARVKSLYLALLGRLPDQGGWDFWANQVVSSGDIALATSLATSVEYYNRAQLRFP